MSTSSTVQPESEFLHSKIPSAEAPPGWFYSLVWNSARIWSDWYFQLEVVHEERLPPAGPCLIAPTHTSYLDPPLVGSHLKRPMCYMARETLFKIPILGVMLRNLHTYPIRRGAGDREALRTCRKLLQAGWSLML